MAVFVAKFPSPLGSNIPSREGSSANTRQFHSGIPSRIQHNTRLVALPIAASLSTSLIPKSADPVLAPRA